eukprot:jgi/Bigna1/140630/aug1.57_g15338
MQEHKVQAAAEAKAKSNGNAADEQKAKDERTKIEAKLLLGGVEFTHKHAIEALKVSAQNLDIILVVFRDEVLDVVPVSPKATFLKILLKIPTRLHIMSMQFTGFRFVS